MDLVTRFVDLRADPPAHLEAFLREAGAPSSGQLRRLLEHLTSSPGDAGQVKTQCQAVERLVRRSPDRSLFIPLVAALRSGDPHVRGMAATLLPLVDSPGDHRQLALLLRSPDGQVRQLAARVLSQTGGRVAFDTLVELVKEPSFHGRREAADALARFAAQRAIPALRTILRVGTVPEQERALRHLGDPSVVGRSPGAAMAALAEFIEKPGPLRLAAVTAFCAICSEDAFFVAVAPMLEAPALEDQRAAIAGLARFQSPRALAALERKLRAGPNALRLAVLASLESLGTSAVLPVLVKALTHPQVVVRTRAADVLRTMSQKGQVALADAVLWLAQSRDVNARRMAADLARTSKDPRLWEQLVVLLRDVDWWVRERVADALVELSPPGLAHLVVPMLHDPSDLVRGFAAAFLGRLKSVEALSALAERAGTDPDWWVCERAIEAMGEIGDGRAQDLLLPFLSEGRLRLVTLKTLKQLGPSSSLTPHLAPLVASKDAEVRLAATECLAATREPGAAPLLETALTDEDPRVREVASTALAGAPTAVRPDQEPKHVDRLLARALELGADDVLVVSGQAPSVKRGGRTLALGEALSGDAVKQLLERTLAPRHWQELAHRGDVDLSHVTSSGARFRLNVYRAEAGLSAVFRTVRRQAATFETLGLPPVARSFTTYPHGLVLVAGPTGSGKSSTLAALTHEFITQREAHVITFEDPVELVHQPHRCLVNQREVGTHTTSYASALKTALRLDPDVLVIGELRDLDTIGSALTAAETGHLVLATVHAASADTVVDRLVNAFAPSEQDQVRAMLSLTLRAILCQQLVDRADGTGRTLAAEVLLNTEAVAHLIRQGKTHQLPSLIASSREVGMQSLDDELRRLFKAGVITAQEAYLKARVTQDFEEFLDPQAVGTRLPGLASLLEPPTAADESTPSPEPLPAAVRSTPTPPPVVTGPAAPPRITPVVPAQGQNPEAPPRAPAGHDEARALWEQFLRASDRRAVTPEVLAGLEALLGRTPGCAPAAYACGQIHLFHGDGKAARAWFERTLALDPQHQGAHQRLTSMRG
ncbi:MAG: PilT/PilU family type 4a pilus ATPase [Myxococcaceae bacterium]|nr:PilT/PilU family type 4a pilus ATPase [Myxococcaceae bacterium]